MEGESLHPLARELLIRYSQDRGVASALSGNFVTGIWWGSFANWLESHLKLAREWAKDPHPAIRAWAQREVESLERQIQEARREEEEEDW